MQRVEFRGRPVRIVQLPVVREFRPHSAQISPREPSQPPRPPAGCQWERRPTIRNALSRPRLDLGSDDSDAFCSVMAHKTHRTELDEQLISLTMEWIMIQQRCVCACIFTGKSLCRPCLLFKFYGLDWKTFTYEFYTRGTTNGNFSFTSIYFHRNKCNT